MSDVPRSRPRVEPYRTRLEEISELVTPEDFGFTDPNNSQRIAAMSAQLAENVSTRGRYARRIEARHTVHMNISTVVLRKYDARLTIINAPRPRACFMTRTELMNLVLELCDDDIFSPTLELSLIHISEPTRPY